MTLPKNYGGSKSTKTTRKNKIRHWSQFSECWTGTGIMIGIMIGIWAVTFGILASGILPF